MKIIVSNNIVIQQANNVIRNYCNNKLVVKNPDFYKLKRLGKWTGNTPEKIYLYENIGDTMILPFGCLQDVWKLCPDKSLYNVHFEDIRRCNYESDINLYDYQETAVSEVLKAKNGILVMPTGAGKTQTGLEIIARIGGRALWLTHTQDLLHQSAARAVHCLNVSRETLGFITAGKVKVSDSITFATVQTMCRLELKSYKDTWDVIIVDECHHLVGSPTKVTQFYKVLSSLSARYKIGLTATPTRADGLENAMLAIVGDVIHTVQRENVAERTCKVIVEPVHTGYAPDIDDVTTGDGTIDYPAVVDDLIGDYNRFRFVLETIEKLPVDSPTLVLANRVEYLKKLNQEYFGRGNYIAGNTRKDERVKALKALNNGDIDCLFATYQLAKEGLDVPNLRYVVFATPEKTENTVVQAVGRVARKADGKEYGTVIDFVDDFGMYRGWYQKRKGYYRKIGAEVIECRQ